MGLAADLWIGRRCVRMGQWRLIVLLSLMHSDTVNELKTLFE